jgi:SH3-like domain-containing protein
MTERRRWVLAGLLAVAGWVASGISAGAIDPTIGTTTGLPLPRFASLKSDRVNLREGPSKDHRTKWIYEKAGLPVEITAEFETWRRIRDSEGAEGWVLHNLLSGRRTAIVTPWAKDTPVPLRSKGNAESPMTAQLMPNVVASIKTCDGQWCRLIGDGFDGWVQQQNLWGVYPEEKVE